MEKKHTTNLDKRLSPINVWSLALGCIIGWGAFVMPGNTFLCKAGPLGTAIAMGIATLIMIIIAMNYQYLIIKYPIAGGEFTYTEKSFGRNHAFVCSWFLGLSYLAIVPLNATALALVGRNLMGGIFQTGIHYQVAGYDIYWGEILLALFALVLFAILCIKGVAFTGKFQTMLVFLLVGSVLVVFIAAILDPRFSVNNLYPLYNPRYTEIGGILSIVAVAPWAFIGFDTIPQAAEEFHFSPRKTKSLMIISIFFGALIYVILNTITAMYVPAEYASWVEYIDDIPNLSGLISLPTFYMGAVLMGRLGLVLLGIAVLAAILSGILGFYMATSRLLYSMAQKNVLPAWFGYLDEKNKTPRNAILFIMVISMIAPFFGRTALGWIVDMSSLGAAIGYGYTSLAALKHAVRERDIKIIVTGGIGTIMALVFMMLLLVPIATLGCSLGKESYICLLIWILLGCLFYWQRKHSNVKV